MSEYRWLTELSQQFLERDYLLEGQSVDERVDIICKTAECILKKEGFADRFKENIKKGWYSLSSPIWANFGTDRGLPISCFGCYIDDSMESIIESWGEVAMQTKYGGGTSGYFGALRGRGEPIRQNGQSSGAVHFMQAFDNLINVVSQGKVRRGNFAAYLPVTHPDIMEFLQIRSEGSPIQDLSFGVCVPEGWMQEMIDGDAEKRKVWAKVLESRANTGYPYIFFADNANAGTVDCYKDQGMRIEHTNLCVTGDQLAVTSDGLRYVRDLYEGGESLTLFDGEKPVKASPMRLVEKSARVYEITTFSGRTHKVTDYHKIKTPEGMVVAKDLRVGDKVYFQKCKGMFGKVHAPDLAFVLGLYQADGTQNGPSVFVDLWEDDWDLIPVVEETLRRRLSDWGSTVKVLGLTDVEFGRCSSEPKFHVADSGTSRSRKQRLGTSALFKLGFRKHEIPRWILEGDEETQWAYLKGLYYTDGTVGVNQHRCVLSITSVNRKFLQTLQILLTNLGMNAKLYKGAAGGQRLMPDQKGGKKWYNTQPSWRLNINNRPNAIEFERRTGFLSRRGVTVEDREYRDNTKKCDHIVDIQYVGREDVYCTTVESEEHVWVCNTLITSNCSEIMLPDNEEESFVCDLSSMNILYFDEWKDTDAVELLVYFLDAVMTEFIEKAWSIACMGRCVRFAERHRALGIGWLGYHSYLQQRMIPFESLEAKATNKKIAKTIHKQAYAASEKLAKEYGEPPVLEGYGRRNTTLLAIAPTKSSAFILGQVSEGIEPHKANIFIKDLAKGKFTIKNHELEALLEEKGKNTPEVWDSILKASGSVQHLDFLNEREKAVFKTFAEISPREIVLQAAQRQEWIDQGQSLNLMIHPSVPTKDVNALIIEAWKSGVRSLYYQISVNAAQSFSRDLLSCVNCEA